MASFRLWDELQNSCNVSGGGETVSPTDMKLIPAGRNTGIQPLHKGYRLWIKTTIAKVLDIPTDTLLCVGGE